MQMLSEHMCPFTHRMNGVMDVFVGHIRILRQTRNRPIHWEGRAPRTACLGMFLCSSMDSCGRSIYDGTPLGPSACGCPPYLAPDEFRAEHDLEGLKLTQPFLPVQGYILIR